MSFTDRLILWLHIGVAIFTIGPATAAIMSTPRYIRKHDTAVVGFLHRITRVYTVASLLVFVFGLVLADMHNDFSKPWISISMTLFVVALVLLVLIIRDQGAAFAALEKEAAALAPQPPAAVQAGHPAAGTASAGAGNAGAGSAGSANPGDGQTAQDGPADSAIPSAATAVSTTGTPSTPAATAAEAERIAAVERGRIASLGGVTSLIWLVILILMVWR